MEHEARFVTLNGPVATLRGAHAALYASIFPAHLTYELGYKSIVPKLDDPPMDDLKNFLGYCEAWGHSIVHHHDTEVQSAFCVLTTQLTFSSLIAQEVTVFPFLSTKMDFSHEKEQHKEVHEFLDKFLDHIHTAQADHAKFDAKALKELMEGASKVMVSVIPFLNVRVLRTRTDARVETHVSPGQFEHFDEELTHIEADKFRAAGFTEDECRKMVDDMVAHAKKQGDPFLVVPYMRWSAPPLFLFSCIPRAHTSTSRHTATRRQSGRRRSRRAWPGRCARSWCRICWRRGTRGKHRASSLSPYTPYLTGRCCLAIGSMVRTPCRNCMLPRLLSYS